MKFKFSENLLMESNNTNLRKFLIGLVSLVGIEAAVEKLVVHHTERDEKINDINKLVLMYNSDHRSMHAKYRGVKWRNDAHLGYYHIPVNDLMGLAVQALKETSKQDESTLPNSSQT